MAMLTRIALVLALIGTSVTASAAADRNVVATWNSANAHAQVQKHPSARSVQQPYNDHRAFAYAPRSRTERGWAYEHPNAYERPGMSWDSYGLRWDGGN
jgi:hypothetical protein